METKQNNYHINEEIKELTKTFWKLIRMKAQWPEYMGHNKTSTKRKEIHSNSDLNKKAWKILMPCFENIQREEQVKLNANEKLNN